MEEDADPLEGWIADPAIASNKVEWNPMNGADRGDTQARFVFPFRPCYTG